MIRFTKTIYLACPMLLGLLFTSLHVYAQLEETRNLKDFSKIVLSSNIKATFVQDDKNFIELDYKNSKAKEVFNLENDGRTLHLFLKDARYIPKNEKHKGKNYKYKKSIYPYTMVNATVHFRNLDKITIIGEEHVVFENTVDQHELDIVVMGESDIVFKKVKIDQLHTKIFGETKFTIESGDTGFQKYSIFGEADVDTSQCNSRETDLVVFGEADMFVHAEDRLYLTVFGEADINYLGNPSVKKRTVIGETTIRSGSPDDNRYNVRPPAPPKPPRVPDEEKTSYPRKSPTEEQRKAKKKLD